MLKMFYATLILCSHLPLLSKKDLHKTTKYNTFSYDDQTTDDPCFLVKSVFEIFKCTKKKILFLKMTTKEGFEKNIPYEQLTSDKKNVETESKCNVDEISKNDYLDHEDYKNDIEAWYKNYCETRVIRNPYQSSIDDFIFTGKSSDYYI